MNFSQKILPSKHAHVACCNFAPLENSSCLLQLVFLINKELAGDLQI
jgi:hypothetical protein